MLYDPNDIIIELLRNILEELHEINRTLDDISSDTSTISVSID